MSYTQTAGETSGNIESKSDVGDYIYEATQPHAVSSIENPVPGLSSLLTQNITYNSFNKVHEITEGSNYAEIVYGSDEQRKRMEIKHNGITVAVKYYQPGFEKINYSNNTHRYYEYISTPDGICAIHMFFVDDNAHSNDRDSLYYIHTDHLGSISLVTDIQGNVKEELSYYAWGRRRNPDTWTLAGVSNTHIFARGYTGHEHLDIFNLINMNGRVYDPLLGRMLSPDNYIQAAGFTQSYNRYSYCVNNPLKYTDPSGYITWSDVTAGVCIVAGIIVLASTPATNVLGVQIGSMLLGSGLTHFGIALSRYSQQGYKNWNDASNYAGINLSINYPFGGGNSRNSSGGSNGSGPYIDMTAVNNARNNNYYQHNYNFPNYDNPSVFDDYNPAPYDESGLMASAGGQPDGNPIIGGIYDNTPDNIGYHLRNLDRTLDGFYNNSGQAPAVMKWLVSYNLLVSVPNATTTIITGTNSYGIEQFGAIDRVILPIFNIFEPIIPSSIIKFGVSTFDKGYSFYNDWMYNSQKHYKNH